MLNQKAMSFVNMYGVLGTLENLCEIDSVAKEILSEIKKPVRLCFEVEDGPCCTFSFTKDGCKMTEGTEGCNCKMKFASPEKFNDLINNSKPGVPTKAPIKTLLFLLGPFTKLTDRLSEILRPEESALKDKAFFNLNTILTMYTIAGSISALANNDEISMISASNTVDGDVQLGIKGEAVITISVKDHQFKTIKATPENPRAVMEFASLELANGLFNGKVSTINEMCKGNIALSGMISMIDNINRILDRVAVYLA